MSNGNDQHKRIFVISSPTKYRFAEESQKSGTEKDGLGQRLENQKNKEAIIAFPLLQYSISYWKSELP